MREYFRVALRNINGDSQFAQLSLKVVGVGLQVADEQRRLAGRGYDGRVIRVKGYSTWCEGVGKSLTYRLKRTGEINPP